MDLLRLVVVGSVDDGKSTLVGRLLLDTDSLLADQWDALATATERRGRPGVDLSLVTDGLRAEREQAITIDVAHRRFATERRVFLVADCPGHVEYTRNTVTGASTADAALVLVDATRGIREQTRRHTAILGLLGVPQVVFALNKMDAIGWDAGTVERLSAELEDLAAATGVRAEVVPVSALTGDGVPTLLDRLDRLAPATADAGPFRLPVQLVLAAADGPLLAGRVTSGRLEVGDEVTCDKELHRVVGIEHASALRGDPVRRDAHVGESITLRLDRPGPARGSLLTAPHSPATRTRQLHARLCWLAATPPTGPLVCKAGTATSDARITAVTSTWNVDTLGWEAPRPLALNDLAEAEITLSEPLDVDRYADHRATGAFLLIDPRTGATVAAGMTLRAISLEP